MTIFLVTALMAFILMVMSLLLASFRHPPKFHHERLDFVQLLQYVLTGQASYEQWSAIVHLPIKHDPALEAIRLRCIDIEQQFYMGKDAYLGHADKMFAPLGLQLLEEILLELQDVKRFNPE